jgi:C-terminal processing protease CtpA/Prc
MDPRIALALALLLAPGGAFAQDNALVSGEALEQHVGNVLYQTVATDPPSAANEAGQSRTVDDADLESRLKAARERLEESAREVAELSTQLGGPVIRKFSTFNGAFGRAIIGVQLDPSGDKQGARVLEVSPGGPAAEAGIRPGDVIVAVNGTAVTGEDASRQVVKIIRDVKPDSKVNVRVLRDGKTRDLTVTARPPPDFMAFDGAFPDLPALPPLKPLFIMQGPLSNMELATLTPQLGKYFGTDKGVLVVRSPPDGVLKLEDGDVILAIDGREPTSGSHATRILGSYQPGEKITLRIVRQRKTVDLQTTVPEEFAGPRKAIILRDRGHEIARPPGKVVIMHQDDTT